MTERGISEPPARRGPRAPRCAPMSAASPAARSRARDVLRRDRRRPPRRGRPRASRPGVASQEDAHRAFGGVVPEIAARAPPENLPPLLDAALARRGRGARGRRRRRRDGRVRARRRAPRRAPEGRASRSASASRSSPSTTSRRTRCSPFLDPTGARRRRAGALRGARRLGRPHALFPFAGRAHRPPRADARRRGGRGLRQGREDGRARLPGRPRGGPARAARAARRARSPCRSFKDGSPDFSFSGLKTAVRERLGEIGRAPVSGLPGRPGSRGGGRAAGSSATSWPTSRRRSSRSSSTAWSASSASERVRGPHRLGRRRGEHAREGAPSRVGPLARRRRARRPEGADGRQCRHGRFRGAPAAARGPPRRRARRRRALALAARDVSHEPSSPLGRLVRHGRARASSGGDQHRPEPGRGRPDRSRASSPSRAFTRRSTPGRLAARRHGRAGRRYLRERDCS